METKHPYVVLESLREYHPGRGPWWVTNNPKQAGHGKAPDAVCRSKDMAVLIAKLLNEHSA
jgi:hypothetical protein